MKRSIWTGTFTAIIAVTTAAMMAQTPQTPQTPPQTPPAPPAAAQSSQDKVTVTGCLRAAPSSTSSSVAATPEAAKPDADQKFVLTEATAAPAAPASAPTGEPSTPQAPPPTASSSTPSASTYRLIANPSALTPHLGKKLALTGTIESAAAAAASQTSPAGNEPMMPSLKVESGKIVAETCTAP